MKDDIGPTGRFPDGKICPGDLGELIIGIGLNQGYVVLNFGTEVRTVGMTPQQALDIGRALIEKAQSLQS